MFGATSAGLVLMALTAGLAIRRTGALPAYTMWLAFIAVVGNLVAMASTPATITMPVTSKNNVKLVHNPMDGL